MMKCLLSVLLTMCFLGMNGQSKPEHSLKVIVKPSDSKLIMRWAPTSDKVWLQSQRGYYVISYKSWAKNEKPSSASYQYTQDTIRVWPKSKFDQLVDKGQDNTYVMLAGYLIHHPYETAAEPLSNLGNMAQRKDELTNRYSSAMYAADMNAQAAEAQGMRYVMSDVNLEEYMRINVHLIVDDTIVYQAGASYDPEETYMIKPDIDRFEGLESQTLIAWNRKLHDHYFTAYWIERSRDGRAYSRINSIPYIHAQDINREEDGLSIVYMDSVQNYVPYYYRIVGIDPFGDESEPSKAIRLMGRDRTPPPAPVKPRAEVVDGKMQVAWEYEGDIKDVSRFKLAFSPDYSGPYRYIKDNISIDSRSVTTETFHPVLSNYYRVCAVDTAGNEGCSVNVYGFFNDSIPPAKPQSLQGTVDSQGVVTLWWPLGPDVDLKGYNVYFSNRHDGVFGIINRGIVRDTLFKDTISLHTLSHHVFYRIVAIDARDNLSPFSDMVKIDRPDTIPPGPSVFYDYEANDSGITIMWHNSTANDLKSISLQRKSQTTDFIELKRLSPDVTSFTDTTTASNTTYTYRLLAFDYAGLSQPCPKDITIKSTYQTDLVVPALTVQLEDAKVQVSCVSISKEEGTIFIYKSSDNKHFYTWKTIKSDMPNVVIEDRLLSPEDTHYYKAMFKSKSGHKSDFCAVVQTKS